MSCEPGKVQVMGVERLLGKEIFLLRFLQCRDPSWLGRIFWAKFDESATWFDELEAIEGSELPWDKQGQLVASKDPMLQAV